MPPDLLPGQAAAADRAAACTIPAASAGATLRLTVRPGCTEREVVELARWAWQEAQRGGARA